MPLWPHQVRGLKEIQDAIAQGFRNICLTSPTGGGKSRMMLERINATRTTSLYTDRCMLFDQISDDLNLAGIHYGKRASGHDPRLLDDVQLCMVQTESSRCLNGDRDVHVSEQVLIDEAHKNAGQTVRDLWDQHMIVHKDPVKIGFTATPLGIGGFYDKLIIAGNVSELRKCGALVPAYHYGPDEPDTKWVGKVKVDDGECGIPNAKRMEYAHQVFGRVIENYLELNTEDRPAILFAPGVKESLWFAQELSDNGIKAAHIDGENCWVDGVMHTSDKGVRDAIRDRLEAGEIKIVCNRFVLREGINWPFVSYGIFATIFGSLTSYIQAGGRLLRACHGKTDCIIQDHGGNWWRHGSLNEDRDWKLEYDDRIVAGMREKRLRENNELEPIVCPSCGAIRTHGKRCHKCGYEHTTKVRKVLQKDGTLRPQKGDIFRPRRHADLSTKISDEWRCRVDAIRRSKKATVMGMTFAQLDAKFASEHNWMYASRDTPNMPIDPADWFRPIREVPQERLSR